MISASLSTDLTFKGDSPSFNLDLWALGHTPVSQIDADWRLFANEDSDPGVGIASRIKIQDNLVTPGTGLPATTSTNTVANAALVSFLNTVYQSGAQPGDYAVLRLNPDQFLIPEVGGTPFYMTAVSIEPQSCIEALSNIVAFYTGDSDASDLWNLNQGILQNGAQAGQAAHVINGFLLDGDDDHILVPDSPSLDFRSQFSVEAWINPSSLDDPSDVGTIASKWSVPDIDRSWVFGVFNTGQLFFMASSGQSDAFVLSDATVPIGTFTHVAAAFDAGQVRLYIDGVEEVKFLSITELGQTNNPLSIGLRKQSNGDSLKFHGLIDELRLYDRALLPNEIQQIFNAGTSGMCKDEIPGELEEELVNFKFKQHPTDSIAARPILVGSVSHPPAGPDVRFDMEIVCPEMNIARSCTVSTGATNANTDNDVLARLQCEYDEVEDVALARLKYKSAVQRGQECTARAVSTSGVFRLLDGRFTGTYVE